MAENRYTVQITDEAIERIAQVRGKGQAKKVISALRNLEALPYLGHPYEPVFEHLAPHEPCRVLHTGNYGIYYRVDDQHMVVDVRAIIDQRVDPRSLIL